MYELVKENNLKPGTIYTIKDNNSVYRGVFSYYELYINKLIFVNWGTRDHIFFDLQKDIRFFKRVSPKEYYQKLKDKYDQTCLNIILNRLIEHLVWL